MVKPQTYREQLLIRIYTERAKANLYKGLIYGMLIVGLPALVLGYANSRDTKSTPALIHQIPQQTETIETLLPN